MKSPLSENSLIHSCWCCCCLSTPLDHHQATQEEELRWKVHWVREWAKKKGGSVWISLTPLKKKSIADRAIPHFPTRDLSCNTAMYVVRQAVHSRTCVRDRDQGGDTFSSYFINSIVMAAAVVFIGSGGGDVENSISFIIRRNHRLLVHSRAGYEANPLYCLQ